MPLPTIEGDPDSDQTRPSRVALRSATVNAVNDVVAPCSACGAPPLTPEHRLRARNNVVCTERVADVLLMIQLVLETRRPVRSWAAGSGRGVVA